jgi:NAD(P)-dependent dehydrogenase (short-subunit alcohol dehydrogenase family)
VALVTGAAGDGIGQATARRLASDGATVAVTDVHGRRTDATVQALRTEVGDRVHGWVLDVGDAVRSVAVLREIERSLGPVDILVNNAAINVPGPVVGSDPETWYRVVDVDLHSVYRLTSAVLPGMMRRGRGSIVNVTSVAAWTGGGYGGAYAASKAAVHSFTCAVAQEAGPAGVRCNAVAPGIIAGRWVDSHRERYAAEIDRTPLRRLGDPEEVAAVVAFLASDDARFVTGEVINVSGGWFMRP